MRKKKFIKIIILILLMLLSNILVLKNCNLKDRDIILSYNLTADKEDLYQLFYTNDISWSEEKSMTIKYTNISNETKMKFIIPKDTSTVRFDLGNQPATLSITDIKISYFGKDVEIDMNKLLDKKNQVQLGEMKRVGKAFKIKTVGNDPYITYKLDSDTMPALIKHKDIMNNTLKVAIVLIIDILLLVLIKKSRIILSLVKELNNNKTLIWNLSKNDFKTKYAGSYLGITWAFIQPMVTMLVYWFVFEFGLKVGTTKKDVPFILWFMSGMIPWFFFQEALLNATNCMLEYNYLVKKVVFKISVLPIVKIVSALFVHLVFIGFILIIGSIYEFYPSKYTIQLVYYSFCTFFIVLSLSYITSAIVIFFKDFGQIINIFLQIGMWITPIMWDYGIVPQEFQWIVKLNPMCYIVEGYRDTIINKVWFFERYFQTAYFWVMALGMFVIGAMIFKRLKPHFADVL